MTAGSWTFLVGDLRTGRIELELPIDGPSWEAPLNDAGTFSGAVNLADPDLAGAPVAWATAPARSFLAVELDGELLYGGPLWAHRYQRSTRKLRLAGAGLWSVFDHRKILPALALATPAAAAADTVYSDLTLAAVARRLIAQAFGHAGGTLPVVHPDGRPITTAIVDEAGDHDRTYPGYDLTWLGDALRDLTAVEDGPDLELRPRRRADAPNFVEWVLRTGDPYLTQPGPAWHLEATDLVDVDVDVDGTGMAVRGWATGDGTQRLSAIARAEDYTLVDVAGYPLLEADEAHRTATTTATLQSHADALVALRSRPVASWTVTVRTDAELRPGTYAVGDRFVIPIDGDPYLADGDYPARCLSIGGTGDHLTLTMEPTTLEA